MGEQESESPTKSPVPHKGKTMSFSEAITHIINGKKITRLDWKNSEFYGVLKDTRLMLHKPDGKFYKWTINEGDLTGNDWIVI